MSRLFALMSVLLLGVIFVPALAQDATPDPRYVGEVPAPAFPDDVAWINVDAPLTIDGLHGKIILFDFWTYGCINCIHMIPVLEQIEEKYSEEVIIIGVHSAKFENEGETDNLRQIVQRYNLHHPVINDDQFEVWRSYGANAWPTFVIVDPRGNVVARQAGEVPFEAFDQYITAMIDYYDGLGTDEIDRTPLELALEGASDPGTALRFPGKVLADTENNRLFIADSNHHRIVVADLQSYEVLSVIGSGQRGYQDGEISTAQFNQPQGMAYYDGTLFVADVNNHVIRAVNLNDGTVRTLAGDGTMGRTIAAFDTVYNDPLEVAIRSPWDVAISPDGDTLYIAMAGTHQLWKMSLSGNTLQALVGSGREGQVSATLSTSELAQPSGLFLVDDLLYFADSESSTIRAADLVDDSVRVIAGTTDNNLFDFGDVDGEPGISRLQHALGVTGTDDGAEIYIADTYNSKIKLYDPAADTTMTLLGQSGNGGYRDGGPDVAQFDEPGGLDYADGKLYVADTNNHAIRVVDLETETVSTVTFPNPEALIIESNEVTVVGGNAAAGDVVQLEPQSVAAGEGELMLNLTLPEGYKINELTYSALDLASDSDAVQFGQDEIGIEETTVTVPVTYTDGEAVVSLEMNLFYCEQDNETVCLIERAAFELPVSVTDEGDSTLTIDRTVTLPENLGGDL